ncbi:MAG: putative transposase [Dokdonia sp.]|jgi:putative transposase
MKRVSCDTSIKHITRHGLLQDILTKEQIALIPISNISRWKQESDNKYQYSEVNEILTQEVDLIKRLNQSSNLKKINQSYFNLIDTFHEVISKVKGIKTIIKDQKELMVNTIETVKDIVPIDTALKIFNISRTTFQHYKSIVIHRCESSYFHWCSRHFSHQLLSKEVTTIKSYMNNDNYKHW